MWSLVCVYNWRLDGLHREFTLAEYFRRLSSVQIIKFYYRLLSWYPLLRYSSLTSQYLRLIKMVRFFFTHKHTHNSSFIRNSPRNSIANSQAMRTFENGMWIPGNHSQFFDRRRQIIGSFFFFFLVWLDEFTRTCTHSHTYINTQETIDNSESGMKGKYHRKCLKWKRCRKNYSLPFIQYLYSTINYSLDLDSKIRLEFFVLLLITSFFNVHRTHRLIAFAFRLLS